MAKTIACGSCADCNETLVYLKWVGGVRKIIVGCKNCQKEMHFDLDVMVDYMGQSDLAGILLAPAPRRMQ